MSIKKYLILGVVVLLVVILITVFIKPGVKNFLLKVPSVGENKRFQKNQDIEGFKLYTRVTETTWPKLQKYAQPGDLYWGRVDQIPTSMRAFTFNNYSSLLSQFDDSQASKYAAINLDGEYKDFDQALNEAKQIRSFIDDFNNRHQKDPGFNSLRFVAFYHLNIIDAHPDIVNYPDVVIVGKSNWNASNLEEIATPYINIIKNAGKTPVILLGNTKKEKSTQSKDKYTPGEILDNFHSVIDTPPKGLGITIVGYYYDRDESDNLEYALKSLRK
jgi:hypothetical protein